MTGLSRGAEVCGFEESFWKGEEKMLGVVVISTGD